MKKPYFSMIVSIIVVLISLDIAYAYIDLGSGSYMIQILLAGLLGSLFTLKSFWKKIWKSLISFFRSCISQ